MLASLCSVFKSRHGICPVCRPLGLLFAGKRQYFRPFGGYRHAVLGVRRGFSVQRNDCPAVGKRLRFARPYIQHRLDSKAISRADLVSRPLPPVIRYLRRLVHLAAYSMARVITNDPIAEFLRMLLNRPTDVADTIVLPALLNA